MTKQEMIKTILSEYKYFMEQLTDEEMKKEYCNYFGLTSFAKGE